MIYITNLEDSNFNNTENWKIDEEDMMKFPCRDLQKIDEKWRSRSSGRFGFGVQKQIWQERGNRLEYNWSAYRSFLSEIGWIGKETEGYGRNISIDVKKLDGEKVDRFIKRNRRGTLPHYEYEIHEYKGIMPIPSHRITHLLNMGGCEGCWEELRSIEFGSVDVQSSDWVPPPPTTHRILSRALVCKL